MEIEQKSETQLIIVSAPREKLNYLVILILIILHILWAVDLLLIHAHTLAFGCSLFLLGVTYLIYNMSYDRIEITRSGLSISKWYKPFMTDHFTFHRISEENLSLVFEGSNSRMILGHSSSMPESDELVVEITGKGAFAFGSEEDYQLLMAEISIWLYDNDLLNLNQQRLESYRLKLNQESTKPKYRI
jgi:hypothetical protein